MENRRYSSTAVGFPIRNDLSICKPKQKKRIPRGHAHAHTHTRGGLLYSGVHENAMYQNRRKNERVMHQNRRKRQRASQGGALRAPLLLGLPPQTLPEGNQRKTKYNASESSEE